MEYSPHLNTMKIACGIEYDGTGFHGFQRQAAEREPTIQGALETAILAVSQQRSVVYGAGRTDAGVHASGQVIHFSTRSSLPPEVWLPALNANLPDAIAIRWTQAAPEHFHARFSAQRRSYRYSLWNDGPPSPLRSRYSWHRPQALDLAAMQLACLTLLGRKDFAAFGHSPEKTNPRKPGPHSCVRTLYEAQCARSPASAMIFFDFTADAFLTGMVRRLVGTLLRVGQQRTSLDEFTEIVQSAAKNHAGTAAPPHGLCLVRVEYPQELKIGPAFVGAQKHLEHEQ